MEQNKNVGKMISQILSDRKPTKEYEGFRILEEMDNKLSKEQLIAAVKVMKELVFNADKSTRDEKFLFSKGLVQFNKAYEENKDKPDFKMSDSQMEKVKEKIENIRPLVEFIIKVEDVIK